MELTKQMFMFCSPIWLKLVNSGTFVFGWTCKLPFFRKPHYDGQGFLICSPGWGGGSSMSKHVVLLPLLHQVYAGEFSRAGVPISNFYGGLLHHGRPSWRGGSSTSTHVVLLPFPHQVTAGEFSKAGAPVFHNCHVLLYDRPLQHDNMCVPPSPPLYSL